MKKTLTGIVLAAAVAAAADGLYWQHIDPLPPPWAFGLLYSTDTEFDGYGKTDVAELSFDVDFVPIEDFLFGDLGIDIKSHAYVFVDNPDMKAVPDALLAASLGVAYTIRFDNGWAWRLSARPGIYSDPAEPSFGCPFGLNFYFTATDELCFELGGTVRPGWDVPVVPNIGLKYRPSDLLEIELGCPRSRLALFPDHILGFFGTVEWRNTTYGLDDGDKAMPDKLTMDDIIATAGVSLRILGSFSLVGEVGTFLEREISADVETDKGVDLSKEPFVRVSVVGVF